MLPLNRSKRGQAMVEFIIVASVLLWLILGSIQFALIYHAKTTLNYAAFETARAGSVTNARMFAMELAFARAMAPLYTTPYVNEDCVPQFESAARTELDLDPTYDTSLSLFHVQCARQRVRDMIDEGKYVRILLVNPTEDSFIDHGETVDGTRYIPNDNLMYRSAFVSPLSGQSVQDANLIKVHVSFCYKLIVPLVDRMISRIITDAPDDEFPENFGAPDGSSFAFRCSVDGANEGRYGIAIHAESVMRMQSDAIEDIFCAGSCGT